MRVIYSFKGLTRAERVTASCHPSDLPNIEAFKVIGYYLSGHN